MALCPERAVRDAMTDGEFWEHVLCPPADPRWDEDAYQPDTEDAAFTLLPCPVCGSSLSACGYDDEGRPMVHATQEDDV